MMGTHWVHGPRMLEGKPAVTLTTPSQLMFSRVDGKDTLVGVAYAYYADLEGHGAARAVRRRAGVARPSGSGAAGHEPRDAAYVVCRVARRTVRGHESVPAVLGRGSRRPRRSPACTTRRSARACAKARWRSQKSCRTTGLFPILARRPAVRPVLEERSAAIRALVPQLNAARTAADQAAWDALIDTLGSHFDAMREAYLASALDPAVRARIAKALDDMIRGGH